MRNDLPDAAEGATPLTGVVSTASRRIRDDDNGEGDDEDVTSRSWGWPDVMWFKGKVNIRRR